MNNMSYFSKKEVLIDNDKLKKTVRKANIFDSIFDASCNCGMKYQHKVILLKKNFCGHNKTIERYVICFCCNATREIIDSQC